jgi:hypothetical protein
MVPCHHLVNSLTRVRRLSPKAAERAIGSDGHGSRSGLGDPCPLHNGGPERETAAQRDLRVSRA